jgi:aminoglycoside phosphotransferase (APT) family kinase protein
VHFLDVRRILETTFAEDPALATPLGPLEFIHRHNTEVYRLEAGGRLFIVHVTHWNQPYLRRVRDNLHRLGSLEDERIPRVVAWRDAGPDAPLGRNWAMLVYAEVPGVELGPKSYNSAVWADLCDLLLKVHALPGSVEPPTVSLRTDSVAAFPAFAETLLLRLNHLPLDPRRVWSHLDALAGYAQQHASSFLVTPRLIHGDLNRSNLLVQPDRRCGVLDWSELGTGDYAYDLAMLKSVMDSVAPRVSTEILRRQAREYRAHFQDDALEVRLRFFLALPGLLGAYRYASQKVLFSDARAWRVRTCYLHSEAQWQAPLRLDGTPAGAPAVPTEHWALQIPQPFRNLFYVLAPKRVA